MNTTTAQNLQQKLNLPPIEQIGFVVPDIHAAMAAYEPLFGPWNLMEVDVEEADYRGKKETCRIKMAFGYSGELEIELIELVSGNSPHREFLDRGLSGMQHIRYRVEDMEAQVKAAAAIGYKPIWSKRFSADSAFCYMEKEGDPLVIEFYQRP